MHYVAAKICRASEIGINGNLFAGTMLSWLDEAWTAFVGYLCRSQSLITLKMEEVLFRRPVKISHHVRIYASVRRVGTTSLTIDVEARRFDFGQDTEELVCSTGSSLSISTTRQPNPIDSRLRVSIDQSLADFARPR
ncbi:MAG: hypothetical protein FWF31_07815 [Desulfobulbus sp.]|nr:hypothetical protein [Desulfobulbus sp.]